MKTKKLFLVLALIVVSWVGEAQENVQSKAVYTGTVSYVEYVSPMISRPNDLLPATDSREEAKDKRSIANQIVRGQDPQREDDFFVLNRSELEQSITLAPASLVFNAYSSSSQPTDPSLAVGPNHVFIVYNTGFTIYDKSGNQLLGQTSPNPAIFPSGGCCDLTVSYDNAADRWVVTFLSTTAGAQIAVSDGPNPLTAGWYVYTISAIQDYQKLSVWSDGYYITENTSGSNKVWALERAAMLTGNPGAKIQGFNLPGIVTSGFFSPQVLNVTDNNLPAAGGATVVYLQDNAWSGVSTDHIKLWTIDVDWNNTANSTISAAQQINTTSFISVFDNGSFSNLSQPGGGSAIDALQATIMNQAQFRKFSGHNSAVFNFVVDADASAGELAAVRWMELRQNGDNQPWSLYQEGTYTAADGKHAWNASLAMDAQGNIGMGYSSMSGPTTSGTVRVSSYFTGRLSTDPLGVMTAAEQVIANGNQNFSGTRYGDYSKIDVDPSDNSSFWFIDEYMSSGRKGVVGKFQIEAGPPDTEAPTNPTNLTATNITDTGATLSWTASTDNVGVHHYNISINGTLVGTSSTTSFNVTGLTPLTNYTATVNAEDAAGNVSGNASTSFTTLDAPPPSYCTSASTNVNDEYIGRVQLNTIDNASGGQFYSDFTAISTTLNEGQAYTITVTPTWTGTVYAEGYAVWIDYNHDYDFDDAGELVWSKAASTNTPNSGTFTVPSGTSQTATRMRVSMKYNGIPTSCETFTYGEVEDYTIILAASGGDTQAPSTPTNFTASSITTSSATLSWTASTDNVGVDHYNVYINGSLVGTTASTSYNVTGLSPATSYTAAVNAEDAAGNVSGVATTSFTTQSVGGTYCTSASTNVNDEYIGRVQLNTIDNASGAQFYSDFTAISTNLSEGQSYTVTVTPTWTGTVYPEGYAVWIDYNHDFDFDDAGELVWSQAASTSTPNSGNFTVPTGTSQTATRMRVSMKYNGIPTSCETFTYGEVEDYTVNLIAGGGGDTQPPTNPTNLTASNITDTTVDLSWTASTDNVGVTGYEVFESGVSIGTVGSNSANVTGLTANTSYAFTVRAFDAAGNNSGFSNTANVTTTGGGGNGVIAAYYFETGFDGWSDGGSDCARVLSTTASYEGSYSIRLRDNSSSSNSVSPVLNLTGNTQVSIEFHTYASSMETGEDFFVEFYNGSSYQVIGQYISGTHFSNNTFFTDTILLNAATYNFNANNRFRIRCDASNNSDFIYFDQVIVSGDNVSAAPAVIPNDISGPSQSFAHQANDNIRLYPNPTTSQLTIEILDVDVDEIMVFSTSGQLVKKINPAVDDLTFDVSRLANGVYYVQFVSDGLAVTKRFIKE